jgi:hypothetical protein
MRGGKPSKDERRMLYRAKEVMEVKPSRLM